uniref:UBZ2-type domain-containing protein n=1 Tax=Oryzias melastigma TaxID=30732 RepID=A0A3B3BYI5_ORYME
MRKTLDDVVFLQKPSSDQDGWRWCDLHAEVDPFPQSSSSLSLVQQDPASSSSSFTEQRADPQTETAPPRTTEGRRSDRSQQGSGSVGEEEEEQKHGGRGELQSCPMCLQEFPSGFSQMDCDSHLAQCLSDMNVDVTW